jgi:hypothetical protein
MKHQHHKRKKHMSQQQAHITNSQGSNGIRVSGGNLTTPQDIAASASLTVDIVAGSPTIIQALDEHGNLAGGPGEE